MVIHRTRRAYVVHCHPIEGSLTAAARDQVLGALREGGVEVRTSDLYADGFDPRFDAEDHALHRRGADDEGRSKVEPYASNVRWCDTLILVYPTWWSAQPAMLKGWIDRVWTQGLGPADHGHRPRLRGLRRIVVVTTHGSPKWVNAIQGEAGKRIATRVLRSSGHRLARTRWIALYGLDRATPAERAAFLERVERSIAGLSRGPAARLSRRD